MYDINYEITAMQHLFYQSYNVVLSPVDSISYLLRNAGSLIIQIDKLYSYSEKPLFKKSAYISMYIEDYDMMHNLISNLEVFDKKQINNILQRIIPLYIANGLKRAMLYRPNEMEVSLEVRSKIPLSVQNKRVLKSVMEYSSNQQR